eukprot:1168894-Pleurochrysis_carterae.AAC.2
MCDSSIQIAEAENLEVICVVVASRVLCRECLLSNSLSYGALRVTVVRGCAGSANAFLSVHVPCASPDESEQIVVFPSFSLCECWRWLPLQSITRGASKLNPLTTPSINFVSPLGMGRRVFPVARASPRAMSPCGRAAVAQVIEELRQAARAAMRALQPAGYEPSRHAHEHGRPSVALVDSFSKPLSSTQRQEASDASPLLAHT